MREEVTTLKMDLFESIESSITDFLENDFDEHYNNNPKIFTIHRNGLIITIDTTGFKSENGSNS